MTEPTRKSGLIRMVLMGSAFVALTIVLLVFQPGSPRNTQSTALFEEANTVTRVAEPLTKVIDTTAPPALAPVTEPVQPTLASDASAPSTMRDMTFSAISDLKSVTTGEAPAPGQPGSLLHSVVQRSMANSAAPGTQVITKPSEIEPIRSETPRFPATAAYFVRPGDTLSSIAQEVYGDSAMSSEIYANNTDIMARPDSLRAGMVLKLPAP
ncbi:LysM peptidoglycan-binding domain-containing protein [Marivita geojedonensis]|uniref:LysM domain-containing protein n=1 Tax=Marivita geojedonensis TaxID=1123756 RepID=A0A1X4NQH3_9RHOB|nr:LysM domain-containing protein [Marivita geojedonensis]OSQ53203.1 hypothetical protein MGEO_01180 [Marivita geojedonensis]PRY81853.1 LysM domain-containing protein [Marivita geojedonensis]